MAAIGGGRGVPGSPGFPASATGRTTRLPERASRWPRPEYFNWALDWFDAVAEDKRPHRAVIVEKDGAENPDLVP